MSDMKLIMESWRGYVDNMENLANENLSKSKDEKTKIENMSKNVFDEILKQNYFLKTKFELSEPSRTPKH